VPAEAWQSHDPIAATYDRVAVPALFTRPARDLIVALELPVAARVLDVGAGTGVAALLAIELAGPASLVVGLDPSVGMLRCARQKGLSRVVAGGVPGLPHPDATFHRVLANFVLSHCASYQAALSDMVRVLRPGGRLGITAWGSSVDEFRELWQATAERFIDREQLRQAVRQALPWEEWFSEPPHLRTALEETGLVHVHVERREYLVTMTISDFLSSRDISIQARVMRRDLGPIVWDQFRERVANEFHACFRDPLEGVRDAYLAIGDNR
jgi:ubiquinone/menaquinone biosynthesis C-methylase UbiE